MTALAIASFHDCKKLLQFGNKRLASFQRADTTALDAPQENRHRLSGCHHNPNFRAGIVIVSKLDSLWKLDMVARSFDAGWSSLVARQAHNLKVAGSNPAPATKKAFEIQK